MVPGEVEMSVERAILRDGSAIHIREIGSDDKALLEEAFQRLSPESRYRRFFAPLKRLSDRDLKYLTEVDHVDHEAVVAVDPDHGDLVGVARYVRIGSDSAVAEVAITVIDEWQERGLATVLLHELVAIARAAGITTFRAVCLAENQKAIELFEHLSADTVGHTEDGLTEITIDLPANGAAEGHLRTALRHAAAGNLSVRPPSP